MKLELNFVDRQNGGKWEIANKEGHYWGFNTMEEFRSALVGMINVEKRKLERLARSVEEME